MHKTSYFDLGIPSTDNNCSSMHIEEARPEHIPGMQLVRRAVRENVLSNPDRIGYADYVAYISQRGKGWVAMQDEQLIGFAVADLQDHNLWALFVFPEWEGQGIGSQLHQIMLDWYFRQTQHTIWLSTAQHTRAAGFYSRQGWQHRGMHSLLELRMEMPYTHWQSIKMQQAFGQA